MCLVQQIKKRKMYYITNKSVTMYNFPCNYDIAVVPLSISLTTKDKGCRSSAVLSTLVCSSRLTLEISVIVSLAGAMFRLSARLPTVSMPSPVVEEATTDMIGSDNSESSVEVVVIRFVNDGISLSELIGISDREEITSVVDGTVS